MLVTCQSILVRPQGQHFSAPPLPQIPSRNIYTFEARNSTRIQIHDATHTAIIMAEFSLADIIAALPSEDSWGPPTSTETTLNGVPYAPYSKGDKLGRMADWTTEGKEGRDGRGGRQQYNRNYRGMISAAGPSPSARITPWRALTNCGAQTNRFTVRAHPRSSQSSWAKTNRASPS